LWLSSGGGFANAGVGSERPPWEPVYELLNDDKRNAIEVIVEEKAGERDPEHADDITPP
jgi:hypothetical protein